MIIDFNPNLNEKIFLKNPQNSMLGNKIITESINLIAQIGYEAFTFKKLAISINTTEATVYRYFENKHKLLIYLINWYWSYIEFQIITQTTSITNTKEKIKKIIDILVWEDNEEIDFGSFNQKAMFYIAVTEGSKTFLSKEVDENNKEMFYKPLKDLTERIAAVFNSYNPNYQYPNSLASSIIEISHLQYYFMNHLPRLSNFSSSKNPKMVEAFLEEIVFKTLGS